MPNRTRNIIIPLYNPQYAHILITLLVRQFQKGYSWTAGDAEKSEWILMRGTNKEMRILWPGKTLKRSLRKLNSLEKVHRKKLFPDPYIMRINGNSVNLWGSRFKKSKRMYTSIAYVIKLWN